MASNMQTTLLDHRLSYLRTSDILTLSALITVTAVYLAKDKIWGEKLAVPKPFGSRRKLGKDDTRDVAEQMSRADKNLITFFGSQTGGAEDLAARLAKEGHSRFGLKTMTANLEDYDYENLNEFPRDAVAIFVMATFGEGEPTDNAQDFYNFITDESLSFTNGESPLSNLNFISFGLGNSTYEHFNAVSTKIDATLESLGAHRVAPTGRGDDGEKTTEEDFLAWKEIMWATLAKKMGLQERGVFYQPVFSIIERGDLARNDPKVYLGEPNQVSLNGKIQAPFNVHNPYFAPVTVSREIFKGDDRNCLHIDVNLAGSDLTYETGDHVSILPVNSGLEVDRFLNVFGLTTKRDTVLDIKGIERTAKVPFPVPTTYDTIIRYKLDICAPVSRQFLQQLAAFAPSTNAKAALIKLGEDKDYFHIHTTERRLNLAQALEIVGAGETWSAVPFTMLIESLLSLQARHYSISSSSLVNKKRLTLTTKVETQPIPDTSLSFHGVATSYLLALHQKHNGDVTDYYSATYALQGPRNRYDGLHIPLYIRPSTYRLPAKPSTPIIMVGPGTGVAPFRAFVQERAAQKKAGLEVGRTMLFYGCRARAEDFIYEEDWKVRPS
jgi:NADPH-ferrihemoprotein reductase